MREIQGPSLVVNNLEILAINFDFLTCDDGTDCDWFSVSKTFLSSNCEIFQ